ncbi:MAG: CBS domain-containing protein, partial [Bauldia sp.]
MNKAEKPAASAEPTPDPDSSRSPDGQSPSAAVSPERWLERLKAAVGLKPSPTIRDDLADALAAEDSGGGFSAEERAMLSNILRLRDVRIDDIMVPRADIDSVEIGTSLGDLLVLFEKSGHSRMPVYRETLDEPVGLVHIKDLMGYFARAAGGPGGGFDLTRVDLAKPLGGADVVRDILFVPP